MYYASCLLIVILIHIHERLGEIIKLMERTSNPVRATIQIRTQRSKSQRTRYSTLTIPEPSLSDSDCETILTPLRRPYQDTMRRMNRFLNHVPNSDVMPPLEPTGKLSTNDILAHEMVNRARSRLSR
ncbi:uncharacterized protein LOC110459285 [Mizuhopecten yessoensis]|uniref:uncharacterized protein LOC110459285 n=1 Tax=Mizuhopecten yessoensis TaxID=6573 RepID=UPI000B45C7AF|nr:uncharacterized protein LOC110459285 [Mizuhopecten yessoensis]